jgi:F-type H+-transporting ATPase subunit gamma
MANLKEVRDRIKSVISTQQITKAMKMVSAAKFRKAQQAIVQLRPYADKLSQMLGNILSNLESDASSTYGVERPVEKVLVVVVTSNRGLCGAFNTNINKAAMALIHDKYAALHQAGKVEMMFIGKKGYDYFRKRVTNVKFHNEHINLFSDLGFENVSTIAESIMQSFVVGQFDRIEVAYGMFKNAATQFPTVETFLPVSKMEKTTEKGNNKDIKADYIFEPDKQELLDYLVPSILKMTFHKYLLDTNASEHGARMTAMDKATENADELLKELRINYNKARQEAITKELSEIVGGAAALGS